MPSGLRVPVKGWVAYTVWLAASCATPFPAHAQSQPPTVPELEALLEVEVTSAARRQQKLSDTAAAVFVLTRDDIHRSGLTSVPELLRLVPGVQVAQLDGNKWAVSVRGFNSRWANKLLVMVDGRSMYNQLFSGVFWDALDVPVDHIERIEIVRGPGGSLWGANAVNGIINIITRSPGLKEGTVTASADPRGSLSGAVRYAAPAGPRLRYFAHADGMDQRPTSHEAHDSWRQLRYGAGVIAELSSRDTLQLEGGGLTNTTGAMAWLVTSAVPFERLMRPSLAETVFQHTSLRWMRALPRGAGLEASGAFSRTDRKDIPGELHSDTLEATVQHSAAPIGRHEITWGTAIRRTADHVEGNPGFEVSPAGVTETVVGLFAQDELPYLSGRLAFTLGAKVERASHTGWQLQPTVRARVQATARQTFWGAVSRAVRTPSISDRGTRLALAGLDTDGLPSVIRFEGNPLMRAETLVAYEAGYRWTTARIAVDVAAYYNRYGRLATLEPGVPDFSDEPEPQITVPFVFHNMRAAATAGGEVLASFTPRPGWRLTGSYSLFAIRSTLDADSHDLDAAFDAETPRHQAVVRSFLTLWNQLECDASLSVVGALTTPDVPAYARVDARVGWRPVPWLQLAVIGQNLLDNHHIEFDGIVPMIQPSVVHRRVSLAAAWRF